jgi:hypothetical protein
MSRSPELRVPFDYAQGRLSTAFGAKDAPNYAQNDNALLMQTSETGY